jgi:hypothetical protein
MRLLLLESMGIHRNWYAYMHAAHTDELSLVLDQKIPERLNLNLIIIEDLVQLFRLPSNGLLKRRLFSFSKKRN